MRGSDTTAAGGGRREWNEWQWSKFREQSANKKFRVPQQEIDKIMVSIPSRPAASKAPPEPCI